MLSLSGVQLNLTCIDNFGEMNKVVEERDLKKKKKKYLRIGVIQIFDWLVKKFTGSK